MKATSTAQVVVESGGNQVAAHAGLHALGHFDRTPLGVPLGPAAGGPHPRPSPRSRTPTRSSLASLAFA